MCKAALLSQYNLIGYVGNMPSKAGKDLSHTSSLVVNAMDLYLASADDLDVVSFLLF